MMKTLLQLLRFITSQNFLSQVTGFSSLSLLILIVKQKVTGRFIIRLRHRLIYFSERVTYGHFIIVYYTCNLLIAAIQVTVIICRIINNAHTPSVNIYNKGWVNCISTVDNIPA